MLILLNISNMALSPQELKIAEYGKAQGKTKEEVLAAISKFRASPQANQPVAPAQPVAPTQPTLTDRLANVGDTAAAEIKSKILGTNENAGKGSIERGVGAVATAFNVVPQATIEMTPKPVRDAMGVIGEGYTKAINWLGEKYNPEAARRLVDQNPKLANKLESALNTVNSASQIANTILLAEGAKNTLGKVADKAQSGVTKVNQTAGSAIDTTSSAIGTGVNKTKQLTQNLTQKVVKNVSEKNVSPQLQTSVENLTKPTTAPQVKGSAVAVKNPLETYNQFAKQEELFKTNIKADTAANVVGERIGNSFENVVKQQKAFGKTMGDELKKVGGIKTNTQGAFEDFRTQLRDSGVSYDITNRKLGQLTKQTKFTGADKAQLQYYAKEFQKLGTNPTVSDLDAFMSRIPKEIDVYKASKSIKGTTNAERIIKGSLADLRKSLLESGNPALEKYALARSNFAGLSNFIDDGISFLGKKTSSGDFSKDASIAKSSVQSILNGGKKDWLIKLEQLTGYKALDEAVLALQAMKDAGNFRGASLLDLLSPSELPTTKAGVMAKGVDFLMKKGADALTGSPAEQTRRIIQSAIQAQKESAAIASPKGGQSTVNMSSSNSSIPKSVPQQPISSIKVLPKLDALPGTPKFSPEVQRIINMSQ